MLKDEVKDATSPEFISRVSFHVLASEILRRLPHSRRLRAKS